LDTGSTYFPLLVNADKYVGCGVFEYDDKYSREMDKQTEFDFLKSDDNDVAMSEVDGYLDNVVRNEANVGLFGRYKIDTKCDC